MKKLIVVALALAALTALIAGFAFAQEKAKTEKQAQKTEQQPQMSPEEMAAWEKAAAPGPHHQHFADAAGSWKATATMWMQPGAPPMSSEMTAQCEVIFDGRYCVEKVDGQMMGMPFKGMGIMGYDNMKGKHTMVWVDNMGTGTMYAEGTCSDDGKVETYASSMPDPITGKDQKFKIVTRFVDKNKHMFEYYMIGDDGKEFKSMEIAYSRM